MRQVLVTYDTFCQTIQNMQSQGEKVSVRTILSHTGGSFSKIAEFLKRWRAEQAHAQSHVDRELSPNLRQAILVEIGKAVADTKTSYETQLNQVNEQFEEVHEALTKQEKNNEDFEQQIDQLNQRLAIANQLKTQQAEKIQQLEIKLEQSIKAQHEADKRAAISETRYAELEKQLLKQEKETNQ
jgi:chromosome segregation ATPase